MSASIRRRAPRALSIAVLACLLPHAAHAQGWAKKLKEAAKTRAAQEIDTRLAEKPAPDAAAAAAASNAGGSAAATPASGGSATGKRGAEKAWANYDFTPGTRPLFVEDFGSDNVGDFPKRLKFERGNYEVVELRGARWLRGTAHGYFLIPLPEVLPERFTFEMDVIAPTGWAQDVTFGPKARGDQQPRVTIGPEVGGLTAPNMNATSAPNPLYTKEDVIPVRVHVDGKHAKVYLGQTRVANVPEIDLSRDRVIRVGVAASQQSPAYFANIRVMGGGKALYDALSANGRVATQGILFATGSDVVRPESGPTLKEIAAMLAGHAELKLTIEGHTDDAGNAAANQALSQKRAEAVKAALVSQHGIDAARLEAKGFGATKPTASNATAEGRAANRRVELVKR